MVEAVKNLKINHAKYYESNTVTVSDSQGDLTRNPEAVTHTSNGNETVAHTSNGIFEQKILSNRTIPVVVLKMNPRIGQRIDTIVVSLQTLLTPTTKKVVADAALGGTWVNRTPGRVSRTGVDGSTPGDICNAASVKHAT